MLTLFTEIHFWTTQEIINIRDNDYGAFRYHEKKYYQNINVQSKKLYTEKRDYYWNLPNKRPVKLKEKLKDLEEQLENYKVVYCKWIDNNVVKIILNTGLIINVVVNVQTGDIQKISFDKYLVGKLLSEFITDVLITRTHLLITYNDNQCTVVHFNKALFGSNPLEKISRLEPKITTCELAGPPGRKLERTISCNLTGDVILIWWRCVRDEVYPWSPIVKDQDRANIHIYHLIGSKLDLICYRRTECDPINISFSKIQQHIIHCVEQKVSRKGEVTVETCTFEIVRNRLQQLLITSIPLQTQVCCHAFSPDNEKLVLGCIDGSIVLFDHGRGVTHVVKAAFIPSTVNWHVDGALIIVANEKCQIQCFDISLGCIKSQIISEDITSSNILDLSSFFSKNQPTFQKMEWNKKIDISHFGGRFLQTDSLLLLLFEKGPLALLRLYSSYGLKGDVHTSGLGPDNLVYSYITNNQIDRAICVLLSLNWDLYGVSCLMSLQRIVNCLFKQNLTPERENQIQKALGSFYSPLQPISNSVQSEFGEQVKDIARKYFNLLVRYQLFEKAFCLAIDINDYDLFMDLYYYARVLNENEMANAAFNKAKDLINAIECSHSSCSRSDCSQCSDENWDVPPLPVTQNINHPPLPVTKNVYIPPFPQVKTQITEANKFFLQNIKNPSLSHLIKPRLNVPQIIRNPEQKGPLYLDANRFKRPNLECEFLQNSENFKYSRDLDNKFNYVVENLEYSNPVNERDFINFKQNSREKFNFTVENLQNFSNTSINERDSQNLKYISNSHECLDKFTNFTLEKDLENQKNQEVTYNFKDYPNLISTNFSNSRENIFNPLNFSTNSRENIMTPSNSRENVLNPSNSRENILNPSNFSSNSRENVLIPLNYSSNSRENLLNPSNSRENILNPSNSRENVLIPLNYSSNSRENVLNPSNSRENILNPSNSRENILNPSNYSSNTRENVLNPSNSRENVLNPSNYTSNSRENISTPVNYLSNSRENILNASNSRENILTSSTYSSNLRENITPSNYLSNSRENILTPSNFSSNSRENMSNFTSNPRENVYNSSIPTPREVPREYNPKNNFPNYETRTKEFISPKEYFERKEYLFTSTPREIVHKTISLNIPPPPSITNSRKTQTVVHTTLNTTPLKLSLPAQNTGAISKNSGEKNVKFSDTVTAFIVPEIQRSEKPKEKLKRPGGIYMTDPKQELADSLPLCSPADDYLKDFTPISSTSEEDEKKTSKIQVVHFGMV